MQEFIQVMLVKSVEELWTSFTGVLKVGIQEFIPTKLLLCKGSLTWVTQEIKHLINEHNGLYFAYKASGDSGT